MTGETIEQQLQRLIPKSLDDIIREHRDQLRLALATEDEFKALEARIDNAPVRHELVNWNVLMFYTAGARGQVSVPRLIGRVVSSGESWITSRITAVDIGHGIVQTANSVYKISGPHGEEGNIDLLHICATLHSWGLGDYFGVPHIFY